MAVIHRDTDNPHIHLAAARDKFSKQELQANKERTYDLQRDRERIMDRRRRREPQRQRGPRELVLQAVREKPEIGREREVDLGGRER